MPESKNEKDRRKYPRFEIPVKLRPTEFFGKDGRVQNISMGGVRIFGTKNIPVGTILTVDFALPSGDWIIAEVRIVWARERSSEPIFKFDIGCRFIDVPSESQTILIEYLSKQSSPVE